MTPEEKRLLESLDEAVAAVAKARSFYLGTTFCGASYKCGRLLDCLSVLADVLRRHTDAGVYLLRAMMDFHATWIDGHKGIFTVTHGAFYLPSNFATRKSFVTACGTRPPLDVYNELVATKRLAVNVLIETIRFAKAISIRGKPCRFVDETGSRQ